MVDRARGLTVLETGPLALVQDLGRPGHLGTGVGRSGAADRGALRLANRLAGNGEAAAGLEVLLGGLVLRAAGPVVVAVTGATCPVEIDGTSAAHSTRLLVETGQELRLGTASHGLRCYLAVAGGLAVPPVLGSRSTDTLSGLGPAPVVAGDVLPVGRSRGHEPAAGSASPSRGTGALRCTAGPRADWARGSLAGPWTVAPDSDRVGLRLLGAPVRRRPGELASEGLLPGAVQLPPDGRPVVFLADAPVTGGYPVVAVLTSASLDAAAQLRPGDAVRLERR